MSNNAQSTSNSSLDGQCKALDDMQDILRSKLEHVDSLRADADKAEDMVEYTDQATGIVFCAECVGEDSSNLIQKTLGQYLVFCVNEAEEDIYEGYYESVDHGVPFGYFKNTRNGVVHFGEVRGHSFSGKMMAIFPDDNQRIVTSVENGIAQGFSKFAGEKEVRYNHILNSEPLDGPTVVKFENGTKLYTTIKRGELQREGNVTTSKGEALTGMLVNLPSQGDSFTGACSVYTGELERHTNLPIGSGTMHILTENKTFKGNFLNGQLEGPGSYKDENTGEEFTGNFKKGRVEGQGTHHMPGEFLYEGQFKAGKYNGHGKFTYEGAGAYEGQFLDGKFEGEGKMYTTEGDYLEGKFKDWNPDGELKFRNISGKEYPTGFTGRTDQPEANLTPGAENIGRIFTDAAKKDNKLDDHNQDISSRQEVYRNSNINKFAAFNSMKYSQSVLMHMNSSILAMPYRYQFKMPFKHLKLMAISFGLFSGYQLHRNLSSK